MDKKMSFDKKNILIIGGAGFIGSHLCDELVKKHRVICVDNFSSGEEKNIDHLLAEPSFKFLKFDITEPLDLNNVKELDEFDIKFQGIQEIYYLACPMSPKNFEKNKIKILFANSLGIISALEMARKYQSKFLLFSSSVVYGPRKDNTKIQENEIGCVDNLSPRSAYDEGERFAETAVKNYHDFYQLDTKIIRLFRTYGPRMKLDDGHLLPDLINDALENKKLVLFGDEHFKSSFCYISDCIDAAIKMMDSDINHPVNVGSDVDVNITDLAKKIIELAGSKSSISYTDSLLFFTQLCLPDITKARNELSWMPIVPLNKGLERTIYELRANKGLKHFNQI